MNVLLAIDSSDASAKAVDFALTLATPKASPSITLFHVVESLPDYLLTGPGTEKLRELAQEWESRARTEGQKLLDSTRGRMIKAGVPESSLTTKLATKDALPEAPKVVAAVAIIEEMQSGQYDAVCLGRRGTSPAGGSFPGSVAEKVLREAAGVTVCVVD